VPVCSSLIERIINIVVQVQCNNLVDEVNLIDIASEGVLLVHARSEDEVVEVTTIGRSDASHEE